MKGYNILLFLVVLFLRFPVFSQQKLMGFTDSRATEQLKWEKQFDDSLKSSDLDTWMKFLSARPHHTGSAQGKINADYIAGLFRSWGFETKIETYYVLFPTPKTRMLELLGAAPYKAKLQEHALAADQSSGQTALQLPTYNAFSADGDVKAQLVFVNRGLPADYEELKKMGVDVKGKIVIARYGGSWRGLKPKLAAANGAIGCIIYSDPEDDGYGAGDVYPNGPFKPEFGVQRGSVLDIPVESGDPLTPGYAATKDAKRLDRKDAPMIMKIPVIPISYEDALPFLKSLRGPVVPKGWRGDIPITYHAGPSIEMVHLKLEFNWDLKPANNVIAKLKGNQLPDEWVIRGNHHDAWVNGATDPLSGLVATLEEAKGIADLVKKGYTLKRTVLYCAWDAEEQGLLGSAEWVEDHQDELSNKAVLYVNSDMNERGFLSGAGSHGLEPFYNEVIENVMDPVAGVSIRDRIYAMNITRASTENAQKKYGDKKIKLGALGAGSDWGGFLQHLGISSLSLEFEGEGTAGEYHSIYDSYDLFKKYKDPGYHYGLALSKIAARVIMRMANADLLPVEYSSFSNTVNEYAEEIKTLLNNSRAATDIQNKMIADKLYAVAEDTATHFKPMTAKPPVPFLNFSSLENSLSVLKEKSSAFDKLYGRAINLPADKLKMLNENLFLAERSLITDAGLPRRPWYRHQIYAPGYFTGYGVKTLPGIREAIEERNWKEAQDNILIITKVIDNYAAHIQEAIDLLK